MTTSRPLCTKWFCLLILFEVVLAAYSGFAQSTTGTPAFNSIAGDINEGNLNVHLSIPIVTKTGLLPFSYALTYDSNIWVKNYQGNAWVPLSNLGWRGFSNIAGRWYTTISVYVSCYTYNPTYYDVENTAHIFNSFQVCISNTGTPITRTAIDGSGYTAVFTPTPSSNNYSTVLKDGSGNIVSSTPPGGTPGSNYYNLITGSITDTNGSVIKSTWSGTSSTGTTTFTDSMGMTVLTASTLANPSTGTGLSNPVTFTYTGGNGAASVKVYFGNITVSFSPSCSGITNFAATTESVINKIVLPDTSAYLFSYNGSGQIAQVTLPTGGIVKYTYSGVNCSDGTPNTVTKQVSSDGVTFHSWTYSRSGTPPSSSTTTITDPSSNVTKVAFKFYQEVQRDVYTGAATGTPLEEVIHCYNYSSAAPCGTASGPGTPVRVPLAMSVLRVFNDVVSNLKNDNNTTYYGVVLNTVTLSLPTEVDTFDFGATSPMRKVVTPYGSYGSSGCTALANGIVDHLCYTNIYDGANNLKQSTYFSYDSHGNRLTTNVNTGLVNGSWHILTTTYAYYANGALYRVTDPNGTTTTFSNMTCGSGVFPQTISSSAVSWTTSATYNCGGAALISSTNPSGKTTTINYADPYWRVTSIVSPWAGGATSTRTFSYPNPNESQVAMSVNGGASSITITTYVDSLNRKIRTQKNDVGGYDTISQTYDANGRLYTISNPCLVTAARGDCVTTPNALGVTTYAGYDALGRAGSVLDGAGGTIGYTYVRNDVLRALNQPPTAENAKRRQYEYDALGRLTSVCEVTGSAGSGGCGQANAQNGFLSRYSYDAVGRLLSLNQNSQVGGSILSRTFQYDLAGRVISEAHPENGTTTYYYDSPNSDCPASSPGDLIERKLPSGNFACFYRDGLHRLVDFGSGGVCRRFRYDTSTNGAYSAPTGASFTNTVSRLIEAATDNCAGTRITDEWFSYADNGEMGDMYESTANSGGFVHTTATYYENGIVKTLSGIPNLAQSWTYGLDSYARPSTVADSSGTVITGVVYNPAGQITTMNFANGSDTFQYDNASRLASYTYAIAGKTDVGTLTWNKNGTLGGLAISDGFYANDTQTCVYAYDDLIRLTSANCGSAWSQTFTYDVFGNISKSGTSSFAALYANSPQNNRPSNMGFTYDANGNITNDGTNSYSYDPVWQTVSSINTSALTYDAFGRMVQVGTSPVLYSPAGKVATLSNGGSYASARIPAIGGSFEYISGVNTYARMNHADWLGSVRFTSDPQKNVASNGVAYAPFGEAYAVNSSPTLNFTGQMQDSRIANLYDFPARKYSTVQGRWISPDISLGNLSDPQTFNKYGYVRQDPLIHADPLGYTPEIEVDVLANPDDGWGDAMSVGDLPDAPSTVQDPSVIQAIILAGSTVDIQLTFNAETIPLTTPSMNYADSTWSMWMNTVVPGTPLPTGDVAAGEWAQRIFNGPGMKRLWNSANTWGNMAAVGTLGAVIAPAAVEAIPALANRALFGPALNRVFWSGVGYFGASEYSAVWEGTTLDATPVGRVLDFFTKDAAGGFGFSYSTMQPFWNAASAMFAGGAEGPTLMFTGMNGFLGPTFMNYELPVLIRNGVPITYIPH